MKFYLKLKSSIIEIAPIEFFFLIRQINLTAIDFV